MSEEERWEVHGGEEWRRGGGGLGIEKGKEKHGKGKEIKSGW